MDSSPERAAFRAFAREAIAPHAARSDAEGHLPRSTIDALAARGYLGAVLSPAWGGLGMSAIDLGLLHAEIGRACGSTRSLLTVTSMVASVIERWGDAAQKARWLPAIARGEAIAAFALSEPGAGSDPAAIEATAEPAAGGWILCGQKRWTSFAQIADVVLVVARVGATMATFLVDARTPGLVRRPVQGLLGLRASQLADLDLDACAVPREARLGGGSLPFSLVVSAALDLGRYSVACGALGLAEACLAASLAHARARKQGEKPLEEHQLVQRMLTQMITSARAARLLCREAGLRRDAGDPRASLDTMIAKYFATTAASRAAADAVQIHGALGCVHGAVVERCFRDAKILEIIEGSTQIHEITIARHAASDPLDEDP